MNSPVTLTFGPLYQQIKAALLGRVVSGEWAPGTFIPSESALAKEYAVSVGTLRKALDTLASDQVVIRHHGKGTVVATHDTDRSLFQFFHLVRLDGKRSLPASRVLLRKQRAATSEEVKILALEAGEKVIHIKRVRDLDGHPTLLEDVVVSARFFSGLEIAPLPLPNTLYQLYERQFGCSVANAEERLSAVAANEKDEIHLEVKKGTPLLEIRRIAKDLQGKPVEWRVSRCETSQYCYFNEL